jgi:O-antigen/teichoic acid export membrane protein
MKKILASIFDLKLEFKVTLVEILLITILSVISNIALLRKIGLQEFNHYAMYMSFGIIFNSLNIGLVLKLPFWIKTGENKKNVIIGVFTQMGWSLVLFCLIGLAKIFLPFIFLPSVDICLLLLLLILSQQIDELFHANCRLDGLERASLLTNLVSKLGVLFIIYFSTSVRANYYFISTTFFLFTVSFIKIIGYVVYFFDRAYFKNFLFSVLEISKVSKTTWLSGLSNSIFNGIGRVYLGYSSPVGALGIYTIYSQIFAIIQSVATIYLQQIYKTLNVNIIKDVKVPFVSLFRIALVLLFLVGIAFSLNSMLKNDYSLIDFLEYSILSILILLIIMSPIFSLSKFILLQNRDSIDSVLYVNVLLALVGLIAMTIIFYFFKLAVLLLLVMFLVVTISNLYIQKELKKSNLYLN